MKSKTRENLMDCVKKWSWLLKERARERKKAPAIFFPFENKWDWLKVRPQQGVKILRSTTTQKNMIQLFERNREKKASILLFRLTISSQTITSGFIVELDFSPQIVAFVSKWSKLALVISHEINVAIYFRLWRMIFPITFIVNNDQNVGKRRLIQATTRTKRRRRREKINGPQRSAGAKRKRQQARENDEMIDG